MYRGRSPGSSNQEDSRFQRSDQQSFIIQQSEKSFMMSNYGGTQNNQNTKFGRLKENQELKMGEYSIKKPVQQDYEFFYNPIKETVMQTKDLAYRPNSNAKKNNEKQAITLNKDLYNNKSTYQHSAFQAKTPKQLLTPMIQKPKQEGKDIIFKRNTLASEFYQEGMDQRFSNLINFNSVKYSKNSPRGKEILNLALSPDLQKYNLTQNIWVNRNKRLSVNQHMTDDELSQIQKTVLTPMKITKSPFKSSIGQRHYNEYEFETWLQLKMRKLQDFKKLQNKCFDEKDKVNCEIKTYCSSRTPFKKRNLNNNESYYYQSQSQPASPKEQKDISFGKQ